MNNHIQQQQQYQQQQQAMSMSGPHAAVLNEQLHMYMMHMQQRAMQQHTHVTPTSLLHSPSTPTRPIHRSPKYRRHDGKPPYSYIAMIAMAIRDSGGKATLQEINAYLVRTFAQSTKFFESEYKGWKNSVRHNLSLNDCFVKILRDESRPWAKDNYWGINPNSDYTFADGNFQRRRKRLVDSSLDCNLSTSSPSSMDESASSRTTGSTSPPSTTSHRPKFTAFTIEAILGNNS